MVRSSRRHVDPVEVGEDNPLDDCNIKNQENVILKVRLTTSAPTLSLSHPDPNFHLILDVETFYSPQPNSALTISTGRSVLDTASPYFAGVPGAFHLVCIAEGPAKLMLTLQAHPNYVRHDPINKDLLRDPEFDHLHPTVKREELKMGMKYRVWMSHSLLCSARRYSYWGDMEVELKDKKLSSYSPDESPAEELGYSAEVIEVDGWRWRDNEEVETGGNVGALALPFTRQARSMLRGAEAQASGNEDPSRGIVSSSAQHRTSPEGKRKFGYWWQCSRAGNVIIDPPWRLSDSDVRAVSGLSGVYRRLLALARNLSVLPFHLVGPLV
ncbi:hypothetical protein C8J57DRAFT_1256854 [Mycena rebaudengoi]|nr:hypothetical protein C8J57DRAFT_1256854 [Mycena rebaudengoi]